MTSVSRVRTLADIPTPALLLDREAHDRNIRRMAEFFASGPCGLRPHVKAHKTPAIARRQLAAGSCVGLTCATVGEAESVAGFCDDLLVANELIGPGTCERAAALAGALRQRTGERGRFTVAVDSAAGIARLSEAAVAAQVSVGVLVDLNVGQDRCGVPPGGDALALARLVASTPGLVLRGVMGYEGHLQPERTRVTREDRARAAMASLVATAELLRQHGLPCDVVSAGGTGTYDISGRVAGVTEIQAGSYALMDTDYRDVGVPFEQAFWVLGTVVSRPAADRCVADCGHKSVTKDHGFPAVDGIAGATITALNDEHAVMAIPPSSRIQVGERIRLIPSHTDPTVNLHDAFHVIQGEQLVDVWLITARGYRTA